MNILLMFGKYLILKNMKDYHDLYLKCDVVIPGNVFENFSKESINSFELDPTQNLFSFVCIHLDQYQYELKIFMNINN